MTDWYWNIEDDDRIICPYCGEKYVPTYEDTYIGDVRVECYDEGEVQTVTCDSCGKKFTIEPYQGDWRYKTKTVDEEMTEEEWDQKTRLWLKQKVRKRI